MSHRHEECLASYGKLVVSVGRTSGRSSLTLEPMSPVSTVPPYSDASRADGKGRVSVKGLDASFDEVSFCWGGSSIYCLCVIHVMVTIPCAGRVLQIHEEIYVYERH